MGKTLFNTYTRSYAIPNAQKVQTPPRIALYPRTRKLLDLPAYQAGIQGPGLQERTSFKKKKSIKITWQ